MDVLGNSKVLGACILLLGILVLWMVRRCNGSFLAHAMEEVNATLVIVQDFGFVLI
jgi:hypothetical protein